MKEEYSKDNLYSLLVKNNKSLDSQRLKEAFDWAYDLHINQMRKSGEPYIIHPISVAQQLMELEVDEDTIISALLHDVIEDCNVKYEEIKAKFGIDVADLVLAETKVDSLTSNAYIKFSDYSNLKRMLISMTDDVRVILIRLSDRLHNMKTIEHLKRERQVTYSQETLNVYVPLAEYLNIGSWKRELEDIAFRYVYPDQFELLTQLIKDDPRTNQKNIQKIKENIEEVMKKSHIPCSISGRIKSIPSLHNKIQKYIKKGKIEEYSAQEISDLLAFRVITANNNIIDCYKALGAIHANFQYNPERFDDYIAKPKDNGYQSLQTDVVINNLVVEVQIRTKKMHEYNEFGTASHISYKINGSKTNNSFSWVKNLVRWQKGQNSSKKQNFSIRDVFSDKVFVFTPKGQVIEMTKGATVIDFAYRIHTQVGNTCTGAKIDGKIVPLTTKIKTGEIIEIITSKNKRLPNKEWIKWVQPKTAAVIKREISKIDIEKQIESGKTIFKQKIKEMDLDLDESTISFLVNEYAGGIEEDFYRKIFLKMIHVTHILNQLNKATQKKDVEKIDSPILPKAVVTGHSIILVKGHKGMQYYMAKCCNPTEDQELIGFISLEHGVTVHKKDCKIVNYLDPNRLVEVNWSAE